MDLQSKKVANAPLGEDGGLLPLPPSFITKSIHAGYDPEQSNSKAVVPPITMSSTFKQLGIGEESVTFTYGRTGNPCRNVLETCLASLEGAKYASAYPSGLGATTAVILLLRSGDHFISSDDMYGGTNKHFRIVATNFGITPSFVDTTNLKAVESAIQPNTKMIWVETVSNPTLKVTDIQGLASISQKNNIILAVDNSFLTSYFHRPLNFGADIVMHSLTKYLNGHLDIIMGAVVTNRKDLYKKLKIAQNNAGIVPSPFDCSQVSRSLKTLALRMKQHNTNSYEVANFLKAHPKVSKVLHPGLPSSPYYELFKKQCSGYCGMVSFYHKGCLEGSRRFLKALKIFTVAGSLGGMISLAELPLTLSHSMVPPELLAKHNITDNFIRLSVGIEESEDIIADLSQALDQI